MGKAKLIPDVRFNLKKGAASTDAKLILAVYRFNGKKLVYSTQHKIREAQWDHKKQRPRAAYKYYHQYSAELTKIEDAILDYYKGLSIIERKELTLSSFKCHLDIVLNRVENAPSKETTLFSFIEDYIQRRSKRENANHRTIQKLETTFTHLKRFADSRGVTLDFKDINWSFRENFVNYFYEAPRKHSPNTASKYIQTIMLFMKEAERDQLHNNITYKADGFKVQRKEVKKLSLTKDDLAKLRNLNLSSNPRLDRVRDLFLLGCYTGLRFSDFINIRKENLVEVEGYKMLNVFTEKTEEEVYIPFTPELSDLLEKYGNKSPEPISSQRFNEYIREVGELAKLDDPIIHQYYEAGKKEQKVVKKWELITSHVGRRTWASQMYLEGYPVSFLQQVTGHKKESMFLKYVGVEKKEYAVKLAKAMEKNRDDRKESAKVINM